MPNRSLVALPVIGAVMAIAMYTQSGLDGAATAIGPAGRSFQPAWSSLNPLRLLSPDYLTSASLSGTGLPEKKSFVQQYKNLPLVTGALTGSIERQDALISGIDN